MIVGTVSGHDVLKKNCIGSRQGEDVFVDLSEFGANGMKAFVKLIYDVCTISSI
jgi:hypothetical protein